MNESKTSRAKTGDVPLGKMRVREGVSQRVFRPDWAAQILREFDIDKFTPPLVNHVGEWYWIIDGQHRKWVIEQALGLGPEQKIECRIFENLAENEEAELFLGLNTVKAVRGYDKFKIALTAEREDETNIHAIVRRSRLKLSEERGEGAISCVGALAKVYRTAGMEGLAKTLKIAHESFGDRGLDGDIVRGIGLLSARYDGLLEPKRAIAALSSLRGGVGALLTRASRLKGEFGVTKDQCIAAAAVEVINRGKGGKKLTSWWKTEE